MVLKHSFNHPDMPPLHTLNTPAPAYGSRPWQCHDHPHCLGSSRTQSTHKLLPRRSKRDIDLHKEKKSAEALTTTARNDAVSRNQECSAGKQSPDQIAARHTMKITVRKKAQSDPIVRESVRPSASYRFPSLLEPSSVCAQLASVLMRCSFIPYIRATSAPHSVLTSTLTSLPRGPPKQPRSLLSTT